ncbi:sugar phosphate isomerase/epimerase family protein [Paraburkholderia kururiensis]|uniref:sugar phosphate isomerase/epimerase family protein n=1 Tax=Paraburkholderia kururiensis TaxID=984307 RepID=UPI0005A9529A|nr:TIM barrel protein [Paraburkholderia kururiensis]
MTEVVIVASAFGADAVRRDGHRAWIATAAAAGASGFEVRRELISGEAGVQPAALRELGAAIREAGMWPVWSTPAALYKANGGANGATGSAPAGTLEATALGCALDEAAALGARFVKLQLGAFAGETHAASIAACLRGLDMRLVVENGQLKEGGMAAQFVAFFEALEAQGHGRLAGMTFDIGNWQWTGVAPVAAARKLAPHVEYIHCKAVAGEGARRFAVAPAADDPVLAAVLPLLPRHAPRGIEFPFHAGRVAEDAVRYVEWLAAA